MFKCEDEKITYNSFITYRIVGTSLDSSDIPDVNGTVSTSIEGNVHLCPHIDLFVGVGISSSF